MTASTLSAKAGSTGVAKKCFMQVQVTGRELFDLSDDSIWTIREYGTAQELFRILQDSYTSRSWALATELQRVLAGAIAEEVRTTRDVSDEALALLRALNEYLMTEAHEARAAGRAKS